MIAVDKFLFLHFPKTGGSFVRKLLGIPTIKNMLCEQEYKLVSDLHHGGLRDIPEDLLNMQKLIFIRDPLDWYVSLFFYREKFNTDVSRDKQTFINQFHNIKKIYYPYSEADIIPEMERLDIGFYTWCLLYCVSPVDIKDVRDYEHVKEIIGEIVKENKFNITFGRTETLREDFISYLHSLDIEVTPECLSLINNAEKVNTINHQDPKIYYNNKIRDYVYHKDRIFYEFFYINE